MGGGARHLFDLMRSLDPNEFELWVASPRDEPFGPKFRELSKGSVEIPHRALSLGAFLRLWILMWLKGIDVVHSHGRGAGLYSRLLGLLTPAKVVHTFHGVHEAPGRMGRLKLHVDQALAFLPFTAIFVSDSEKEHASRAAVIRKQNSMVLLNAVDLTRFSAQAPQARVATDGRYRVGLFLRDDLAKGPDFFLRFAKNCRSRPLTRNVQFEVAGVTIEDINKFGFLEGNVELKGVISRPEDWLQQIDLFVSTSRSEGLPLGVLEAMAACRPCLLSDIAPHRIFADQGAAKIFALEDEEFARALEGLLESPTARTELAISGRKLVEKLHSLEQFKAGIRRSYLEVLGRN
jgi:glycosyltransferase involved in cell wall biosynthesis